MKSARMLLITLLALGLAGVAAADDKDEMLHGPTVSVPIAVEGSRAVGDDCTEPILIDTLPFYGTSLTNCGRGNTYGSGTTCLGSYGGGEDIIFQLDLAEETTIQIHLTTSSTWTGIAIDDQCPPGTPCIAFATGSSGNKSITNLTLAAGSYFIMVDTWPSPACIPDFNLTIDFDDPPPPPPTNNLCEDAIDLQEQGLTQFQVDLCLADNSYNANQYGDSCTHDTYNYATNGNDVVYKIYLTQGQTFTISQQGAHDSAIWLVTDCSDPAGTCVAGADYTIGGQIETITYVAEADGWYYAIIDGYSGCSITTVWIDAPVSTQEATWSSVKSIFQ